MSNYIDELNKQSRKQFLILQSKQEGELIKVYSNAGQRLVKQYKNSTDGTVTQKMLKEHINHLYSELEPLMNKYGVGVASLPAEFQSHIMSEVGKKAGFNLKLGKMFTDIPKDAMSAIIKGDLYNDGKGLSERIWNSVQATGRNIQNIVLEGLSTGQSALDMAKSLEQYVDPLKRMKSSNLGKSMGSQYGRVEYNSLRLARTTNSHAYLVANKMSCKKNPYVDGLKWNVSAAHSTRMHGKTDICDEYNGKVFSIDDYPFEHPNGLCYPTPEITKSIDEIADELNDWVNGGDNARLDEWGSKYGKGVSKSEIAVTSDKTAWNEIKDKFNYLGDNDEKIISPFKKFEEGHIDSILKLNSKYDIKATIKTLNLSTISTSNDVYTTAEIQKLAGKFGNIQKILKDGEPLQVVRYKGQNMIINGNDKLLLLRGYDVEKVQVHYFDIDKVLKAKKVTEEVAQGKLVKFVNMEKQLEKGMQGSWNIIKEKIDNTPEFMRKFYEINDGTLKWIDAKASGGAFYLKGQGISMNLQKDFTDKKGVFSTFFHEFGHAMDEAGRKNYTYAGKVTSSKTNFHHSYKMSQDPKYVEAIQKDFKNKVNSYGLMNETQVYSEISNSIRLEGISGVGVSDAYSGLTLNKVHAGWGHETDYWIRLNQAEEVASETFANMTHAYTDSNPEVLKTMKKWFPTACEEYENLIKSYIKNK